MKRIIQSKKTGQQSTVTEEVWQGYVKRGIAANYNTIQRILSDTPVELAEVVKNIKKKAVQAAQDTGEPDASTPESSNQNDE